MIFDTGQIVALIFLVFAIITLAAMVRQVPQGRHYTVERFGRYSRTLTPGLGLVIPYIETVGAKVVMMEQVLDVPTQEVITKDNATVRADGVLFYQVVDAARATYQVAQLDYALLNLTMTNIRTVMGAMDLDSLLSHRDEINVRLLSVVDAAASPWGVKVTRIEIKDIVPPADLVGAMGRQMKAERERRAAILEAEGARQSAILKAEGEKQAQILAAEGRKEAAFRDAEARERQAEAEANATRAVSEAIAKGDTAGVNYLIAEKYVAAFAKLATAPNQKVVIIPAEMGGLVGTLGGIAELAKSALGNGGGSAGGESQRRPWSDKGSKE
ncbi:SPFH domain-containing protein [Rhabdaerophilum sp. SD176]|uniref:SPFH domain-containing protein n=1 Tax=Rhabdaerophilum sp. SD176 TaxID=2983548 RepID=UPI0024DF40A0|nr:SPFH domain-containing protein [Rhabdaerophilum sp. SD176]